MDSRLLVYLAALCVVVAGCDGCGASKKTDPGGQQAPTGEGETGSDELAREDTGQLETEDEPEEESTAPDRGEADVGATAGCAFFPDDCGPGESCVITGAGEVQCAPTGSAGEGESCSRANGCEEGFVCAGGTPGTCRKVCRPGRGDCPANRNCIALELQSPIASLGTCQPPKNSCTLWPNDSCDLGEQCIVTPAGNRCRGTSPDASLGARCPDGPTQCQYGQTCITDPAGERRCRAKCTENEPCARTRCVPLDDRPFGYCPRGGRE